MKSTHSPIFRGVIIVGAIIAGSLAPLRASPLAYEDFAYTAGDSLLGNAGGVGWANAWSGGSTVTANVSSTTITKTIDSFTYGGGNSLAISGTTSINVAQRLFASPQLTNGTDIYVSFIVQYTGGTGTVAAGPFIGVGLLDSSNSTSVDNYVLLNNGTGQVGARVNNVSANIPSATYQLAYDSPVLVVARFSGWNGSNYTSTTTWVNPTANDTSNASISATATSTTGSDGAGGLIIRANTLGTATVLLDDLRVGTTWADVVAPIPEPGAYALAAASLVAAITLLIRRRHS